MENKQSMIPLSNEDVYAQAIEPLFDAYQTFQEKFLKLKGIKNPSFLASHIFIILDDFKKAIGTFREDLVVVPKGFEEGHEHILAALEKYDVFLEEYPAALKSGKKGMKIIKKITALGKLSGEADREMKQAFNCFVEAVGGLEEEQKVKVVTENK